MNKYEKFAASLNGAGCSSFNWTTDDNKHIWGRNFDFNRLAAGSNAQFVPRNTKYYTHGSIAEKTLDKDTECYSKYAIAGMGGSSDGTITILYDGINEKGLMGGMLYFTPDAQYCSEVQPHTIPLQPTYTVTHVLSQCQNIDDVEKLFKEQVTLMQEKYFGQLFYLHWIFADKNGEAAIIESDENGLHIYRHTMGVLTNAPDYQWQKRNLLNYANIHNENSTNFHINDHDFIPLNGDGAQGLPGDWSAVARFVRLSFMKYFGIKGKNENEGISNMFRLLGNVAYPMGMVKKAPGHLGNILPMDQGVTPYEYTVYSAAACAESLRYYWISYQNSKVHYIDLAKLKDCSTPATFDMKRIQEFDCVN